MLLGRFPPRGPHQPARENTFRALRAHSTSPSPSLTGGSHTTGQSGPAASPPPLRCRPKPPAFPLRPLTCGPESSRSRVPVIPSRASPGKWRRPPVGSPHDSGSSSPAINIASPPAPSKRLPFFSSSPPATLIFFPIRETLAATRNQIPPRGILFRRIPPANRGSPYDSRAD